MGCQHDYALNGMIFAFLALLPVCFTLIGAKISSKTETPCLFPSLDLSFLQSNLSHHRQNNKIVGFWFLRGIFKTWQQALQLFTVVETRLFLVEM